MERKQHTILRFIIIFVGLLMGFVAVLWQIVKLQTIERDTWITIAKNQEAVEKPITARRGNIFDAEGRLLAGSLPKYTLTWDSRVEALHQGGDTAFYNNIDALSAGLAQIFKDKPASAYKQSLTAAFKRHDGRYRLQRKPVSYTDMKRVKQLPLFNRSKYKSGLIIDESHQRVKPFGTLAGRTIGGIYGETGKGNSGLEKGFENVLSGTPGLSQRQRIAGKYENVVIEEPINGCDLITTIDANLQDIVESMLRQRLEMIEGEWGCCVLMEVKTGHVKAISNLDRTESGEYREMMNHAVTRVEPGSTFKTISLMAALDDGKVNYRKDTFHVYRNGWQFQDAHIYDAHPADTIYDVRTAMAVSSNIALAKMITESYEKKAEKFVNKLKNMGLCDSVPCEIPGANSPLISAPKDMTTLAKMSYGYSVELSPLQILTFYNGIANDGKMVSPLLVKEIQKDGHTQKIFRSKTIKQNLCSESTLREVKECLHAVVWDDHGTASVDPWKQRKAQSDLVHIAGKTGTAQIFEHGHYSSRHHRIAFVGYFPEEAPKYSCICVIHHPHKYGMYDAGGDCGRVVRHIAERTMAYTGILESNDLAQPYDSIRKPHIKGGIQQKVRQAAKGTKIHVSKVDSEWAKVNHDMQVIPIDVTPTEVPNVMGMGARDAVYAIERTGMKVNLHGKGRVAQQSVAPGTKADKGGIVYLELR